MALTITKSGPFFTVVGSAISFSTLRQNFVLSTTGSISASTLIRNAISSEIEPVVPDATENSGISSTRANLSLSQFRNSIKYYNVTHTGTETNYNISGSINWNGNLNKTIVKSVYLTGTYGSTDPTRPAASFNGDTQNVKLYVSGSILGAGGASASGNGGNALEINSSTGAVTVIPTDTSKIYGGGGGGATGSNGLRGLNGACNFYSYYNAVKSCGSDPTCGSDFLNSKSADGDCNCVTTSREVWYPPPHYAIPVTYNSPTFSPSYSCPDPDTLILMSDGSHKRAGDLQVGDSVRTRHESTLEWGDYPVIKSVIVKNQPKLKLTFGDTHLICSHTHKLYVEEKGWTRVSDMIIGDIVSGYTLQEIQPYQDGDVVAIEIDKAHAYISNHLLSHNLTGKSGGCPDPETPILMADGSTKKAGDLNIGDEIRTQHEKTFEWGIYKISQKVLSQQPKFRICFENKKIIVSHSHRFYVETRGWIEASKLQSGDIVNGHEYISREDIGLGTVVKLEVEDAHTYVSDGLLSHNKLIATPITFSGSSCPDPDTLILMSDGSYKRAGDLQVGDSVRTRHESTLEWGDYEVTHVKIVDSSERVEVRFEHTDFICSLTHKFYVIGREWVEVRDLNVGDRIKSVLNPNGCQVLDIQNYHSGEVVMIQIEDAHTYISDGLLSHNKSYAQPPTFTAPPSGGGGMGGMGGSMGGGGMGGGGGGGKSDIRLKKNIRPIAQTLNIIHRYWNV